MIELSGFDAAALVFAGMGLVLGAFSLVEKRRLDRLTRLIEEERAEFARTSEPS